MNGDKPQVARAWGAQRRELLIQFKGAWEASQEGVTVEGKLEG